MPGEKSSRETSEGNVLGGNSSTIEHAGTSKDVIETEGQNKMARNENIFWEEERP